MAKGNSAHRWEEAGICILQLAQLVLPPSTPPRQVAVVMSMISSTLRQYGHGFACQLWTKAPTRYRSSTLDAMLKTGLNPAIVIDHAVPLAVICRQIVRAVRDDSAAAISAAGAGNPYTLTYPVDRVGAGALRMLIGEWIQLVEVLKSEDNLLTTRGFREKMPKVINAFGLQVDWELGDHPMSRYIAAPIALTEVPLQIPPNADPVLMQARAYIADKGW